MAKNSGIKALKNLKNKIGQKSSAVITQRVVVTKKPDAAASGRAAAKKDAAAEYREDTPEESPAKAETPETPAPSRAARKKGLGLFKSSPAAELPASRLARKKKGFFNRIISGISSLIPFKKNGGGKANDALAFADNNKRLGRKGRRNRKIFVYAGTGVVVIAVLLIVFLAPGGVAAPAEATDSAAEQAMAGTPAPSLTATPGLSGLVAGESVTSSESPTATPAATPTPEPTPTPTPVPTTEPEPTPTPIDVGELVEYYIVKADKYYNDMGYSSNHYDYTDEEKYMLAQVIQKEAGGESTEGKIAVGNTVMNRVLCRSFPGSTIKEVVTRPGQFAYNPDTKPSSASKRAAAAVLDDEKWVIAQDVYYFKSGAEEGADWGSHKFYKKIGGHCFYRHSYSGRHRGGDAPPELFDRTYKYAQYGCKKENRVKLGYDVKADGYFGLGTAEELMKFQEKKGLEADGVAGPSTVKALIKEYGLDKYAKKWGID
jgi:spore germination cell wall hydrolase CwlJ-like protein